jgi:hypothetical protein
MRAAHNNETDVALRTGELPGVVAHCIGMALELSFCNDLSVLLGREVFFCEVSKMYQPREVKTIHHFPGYSHLCVYLFCNDVFDSIIWLQFDRSTIEFNNHDSLSIYN